MIRKTDVKDAVGSPLCHDITAMYEGFKGALFKRGHVIEEKDIETLLDIGKRRYMSEKSKRACSMRMTAP